MKLIIDIDKETFNRVKSAQSVPDMWGTDIVNALNSVRSGIERPQGEWIIVKDEKHGDNVKCPFCGKELAGTDLNFCCKCGAKLIGSEKMNGDVE